MPGSQDYRAFVQYLHAEVRDRATGGSGDDGAINFKENVFTELVIEHLTEIGMVENTEVCHFEVRIGQHTVKVNGFSVDDDESDLDLFSCIFLDATEPINVPSNELVRALQRTRRFLEAALKGLSRHMETASDAYSMAARISEIRPTLRRARILILTDGISLFKAKKDLRLEAHGIPVSYEVWDIEHLYRSMQSGLPRDEIEIDFEQMFGAAIPCLKMSAPSADYMAYMTILPAETLYRLYDEFGSRLLEFNVRSFLQVQGKVNRGIRTTLRQEPSRFMAYNNGISMTVDSAEVIRMPDGQFGIKSVRGLQIVNGAQTTVSIYRAKRQDHVDISHVFVPAKITAVCSGHLAEIVPKISLYANSQNVVQIADFSANDAFHIAIERLSETIWCPGEQGRWFYERARGQYQVAKSQQGATPAQRRRFLERTPPARKFTKTDIAKFLHSWGQLPHIVSRGAQKNFVSFMTDRKNRREGLQTDERYYRQLIAKAILFNTVTKIVRQEQFPAYRANIVTYTIAYLSARSAEQLHLQMIWEQQDLSAALQSLLRRWTHMINETILESAAGRNVTEWCKNEACWNIIRGLDLPLPQPFPSEWHRR